jgi:hypothetical protein
VGGLVLRGSGRLLTVTRWIIDAPAPPTFVKAAGFTGNVDRWQIINFAPPPARIHHLERDAAFLIELPRHVQILKICASHGNTGGDDG